MLDDKSILFYRTKREMLHGKSRDVIRFKREQYFFYIVKLILTGIVIFITKSFL